MLQIAVLKQIWLLHHDNQRLTTGETSTLEQTKHKILSHDLHLLTLSNKPFPSSKTLKKRG